MEPQTSRNDCAVFNQHTVNYAHKLCELKTATFGFIRIKNLIPQIFLTPPLLFSLCGLYMRSAARMQDLLDGLCD